MVEKRVKMVGGINGNLCLRGILLGWSDHCRWNGGRLTMVMFPELEVANARTQIQEKSQHQNVDRELKLLVVETKEPWVRRQAANSPAKMANAGLLLDVVIRCPSSSCFPSRMRTVNPRAS